MPPKVSSADEHEPRRSADRLLVLGLSVRVSKTWAPCPRPPDAARAGFSEPTRTWFAAAFAAADRRPRSGAWEAISARPARARGGAHGIGQDAGGRFSGALNRLMFHMGRHRPKLTAAGSSTSRPLKALAIDVERNLRAPLVGIARAAAARGERAGDRAGRGAIRTGDIPGRGAGQIPGASRRICSSPRQNR